MGEWPKIVAVLFVLAVVSRIASRPDVCPPRPSPAVSQTTLRPIFPSPTDEPHLGGLQIPVRRGQAVLLGSLDPYAGTHSLQLSWQAAADETVDPQRGAAHDVPAQASCTFATLPAACHLLSDQPQADLGTDVSAVRMPDELKPSAAGRLRRRFVVPFFCGQLVHDRVVMATEIARGNRVSVYLVDGDASAFETRDRFGDGISSDVAVTSLVHSRSAAFAVAADIVTRTEQRLLPFVERRLGPVADLDQDGRLSFVLAQLSVEGPGDQPIEPPITGCVRPDDFRPDLYDLSDDNCGGDIVYLDCHLPEAEERDAVLAHELAHAATFCLLNARTDNLTELPGWLNEAIAHFIELEVHPGSENLRDRMEQFVANPSGFPLVIPDGLPHLALRRGPARAAACLFLSSTLQQCSEPSLPRLIQSSDRDVGGLEHMTGRNFAELFRRWGLQMMASSVRFHEHALTADSTTELQLAGTSCTWTTAATEDGILHLLAASECQLQVTIVNPSATVTAHRQP